MKTVLAVLVLLSSAVAMADSKVVCVADEAKAKAKEGWQDQTAFQEKLKADGYKIKKFYVTKGHCYEIYGWDKAGKKVEIYFNPVTGEIVKQK